MKVLLVAVNINEHTNQQIATPFGLLYLASYIKTHLQEEVHFTLIDGMTEIPDEDYDVAALSAMSLFYPRAIETAREIKSRKNIPVIIGGPHVTWLPQSIEDCFDVAVSGEGEETFLELLRLYLTNGSFTPGDLAHVNGITFRHEGRAVINPPRPLIEPLDSLPHPSRELWDLTERIKWVCSSRGCPYGCPFCAIARTRYRQNSIPYLMREVREVGSVYHCEIIAVQDDLFCASETRLEQVVRALEEGGDKGKFGFGVSMRADQINENSVRLLKEMNVIKVFIGAESGSEAILKYYKEGKVTVSQNQMAIDLCAAEGIRVEGSFIIGAPGETVEDLLATYNFIFDNYKSGKLSFAAINILTPYPGTQVWSYAKARGLVTDDMDWSRLDLNLRNFDPYRCVYLNEKIPLKEFVDYVEIFEELHAIATGATLPAAEGKSWCSRIDREKLKRFRQEPAPEGRESR